MQTQLHCTGLWLITASTTWYQLEHIFWQHQQCYFLLEYWKTFSISYGMQQKVWIYILQAQCKKRGEKLKKITEWIAIICTHMSSSKYRNPCQINVLMLFQCTIKYCLPHFLLPDFFFVNLNLFQHFGQHLGFVILNFWMYIFIVTQFVFKMVG